MVSFIQIKFNMNHLPLIKLLFVANPQFSPHMLPLRCRKRRPRCRRLNFLRLFFREAFEAVPLSSIDESPSSRSPFVSRRTLTAPANNCSTDSCNSSNSYCFSVFFSSSRHLISDCGRVTKGYMLIHLDLARKHSRLSPSLMQSQMHSSPAKLPSQPQ